MSRPPSPPPPPPPPARKCKAAPLFGLTELAVVAGSLVCIAVFTAWDRSHQPPPKPPLRLAATTPEGCRIYERPSSRDVVICPEGWRLAR